MITDRKVLGGGLIFLSAVVGASLFAPISHTGVIGCLIPSGLYLLFGHLDMQTPFLLALIGATFFLPIAKATASAIAFVAYFIFLLESLFWNQGIIGSGIDLLLRPVFQETLRWVLVATYLVVAFVLLLPKLKRGST